MKGRTMLRYAWMVAAVAALAGCTHAPAATDPAATTAATTAATSMAPAAEEIAHPAVVLAAQAGCMDPAAIPEKPLLVQEAIDCRDAGWTVGDSHVSFMAFGSNDGRDAWLQVAAGFGDVGVIKGDRWVVEIPDGLPHLDAVAKLLAERLDGQRVS
jgi:hypothetical protein